MRKIINFMTMMFTVLLLYANTTMADDCSVPPLTGDWVINSTCTLPAGTYTAAEDIQVTNSSVLIINQDAKLFIDLCHSQLMVRSGSGILIEPGGQIEHKLNETLANTLNVYPCDGAGGCDDSTNIQNAIDAACTGDEIFLNAGTYELNMQINIDEIKNGIIINGEVINNEPAAIFTYSPSFAGYSPLWIDGDNNTIRGIMVQGYYVPHSRKTADYDLTDPINKENHDTGIHITGRNNLIENCVIQNNTKYGISISPKVYGASTCYGNKVLSCTVENNASTGIGQHTHSYGEISNNVLTGNFSEGITVDCCSNYCTVSNNVVDANRFGIGGIGIDTVIGCRVFGNTITNQECKSGIQLYGVKESILFSNFFGYNGNGTCINKNGNNVCDEIGGCFGLKIESEPNCQEPCIVNGDLNMAFSNTYMGNKSGPFFQDNLDEITNSLLSLTTVSGTGSIVLNWETTDEVNHNGFYVFRSTSEDGVFTCLNESDPILPGASPYSYTDNGISGEYFYKIIQHLILGIDVNGDGYINSEDEMVDAGLVVSATAN